MAQETLLVCILCRFSQAEARQAGLSEGQALCDHLKEGLKTSSEACIRLLPVRCMGACSHACTAAFMAPNKLTFILSQLSPTDSIPDLLEFSRQYIAASDGKVPYKDRPAIVKQNIHAVLPPLPNQP